MCIAKHKNLLEDLKIESLCFIPLIARKEKVGYIALYTKGRLLPKDKESILKNIFMGVGKGFAIAVLLNEKVWGLTEVMMRIFTGKDIHTRDHCLAVERLCRWMAKKMEIEDIEDLVFAARLHDIGKILIPAEILLQPKNYQRGKSSLPEDEKSWGLIELHPNHAEKLLKDFFRPQPQNPWFTIIYYHHKNVNGSGYPNGASWNQVDRSLYNKIGILQLADRLEAMIAKRPYKEQFSKEKILNELRNAKDEFRSGVLKGVIGEVESEDSTEENKCLNNIQEIIEVWNEIIKKIKSI